MSAVFAQGAFELLPAVTQPVGAPVHANPRHLFNACLVTPECLLSETSLLVWPRVCSLWNASLFLPVVAWPRSSSPPAWGRNASHAETAHSAPLTSKKLKEGCYRAQSQSGGWWMALSSLIVLPSSTEREQISARAEWCVRPLLPSYGAPGPLMWLSLYCRCKDRKSRLTERNGET